MIRKLISANVLQIALTATPNGLTKGMTGRAVYLLLRSKGKR
jgi:hypothetical protein